MGSNDSMGYTVYVCVVVSSFRGNIFKNKHRNLTLWLIFIGVILGASLVFLCRVTGFFFFFIPLHRSSNEQVILYQESLIIKITKLGIKFKT